MSTILTERKRYNYNVGITQSTRSSLSQKKLNINPIVPVSNIKDENIPISKTIEVKEANRKM